MKVNTLDNQIQQSFYFQLSDGYLFIRSVSENELNNLTLGKQGKIGTYFRKRIDETLLGLINKGKLEKTYGLPKNFNFNSKCFEMLLLENAYHDIYRRLKELLSENPNATIKDILHSKYKSTHKKRKVGRQKIYRDVATNEIVGAKDELRKIINTWDETGDIEAVRFRLHPKTKYDKTKIIELSQIRRKLRDYNYLLLRKYNGK